MLAKRLGEMLAKIKTSAYNSNGYSVTERMVFCIASIFSARDTKNRSEVKR